MRQLLIITISILSSLSLQAQNQPVRPYVKQDAEVDRLVNEFRQENRNNGMQGYRIQIYTASGNRSRLLAEREKAAFDSSFPGIRSYIKPEMPYYKLRVGDFRSRLEAEKFLKEISSKYIHSIVVIDKINLPRLNVPEQK